MLNRREFQATTLAAATAATFGAISAADEKTAWRPRYMLPSCMYGYAKLAEILPEVAKIGASAIDLWPKPHGDQREQLSEMGEEKFADLLKKHNTKLGCLTQYKLGPFGLQEEMQLAKRFGCKTIVTGGKGPKGLKGGELKAAVKKFAEQMKPHLAAAEETGVTIAIENHGNNLIDSADSLKWLVEFAPQQIGVALAPYHLPQEVKLLTSLIHDLKGRISVFYAWQHGHGCMTKLPKEEELLQMPGRGDLDFAPIIKTLGETNYQGWIEIFMHPVPRGVPILETTTDVTKEINRARSYLNRVLE